MALLSIRDLHFAAGGRSIINGVDLDLAAGEIHALLGTNGTGKSTLAGLIMGCGQRLPDRGEILFAGHNLAGLAIHQRAALGITLAWQEPARFEGLTVRTYLTLSKTDVPPAAALAMVGLDPDAYLERCVDRTLSGGERKRIELAAILTLAPRLAILDEPDSGIDLLSTADLLRVIAALKAHGAAILLITHREEIAHRADTASLLCQGQIVCRGTPRKVTRNYRQRRCHTCAGSVCDHG